MFRAAVLLFWNNRDLLDEQERRERNQAFYALKLQRSILRHTTNVFLLPADYFLKSYRMLPAMVLDLVRLLEDFINQQGASDIPVHLQVLCAFRFFAEGVFQKGAAQDFQHPLGQSTFSKCLGKVVNSICHIAPQWIRFPATREEREAASNSFAAVNRIPGVIGCIDCTVVKILRPSQNEEAFYNHEHKHSLNVQAICGANKLVYSVRICPGSNNDQSIWKFSDARHYLRSLRQDPTVESHHYIFGDSGYSPSPVLLTPIRNAQPGSVEALYTREFCRTRCVVEQLFGDFSNVFICSSRRRVLYHHPEKAAKIILCIAILHNFKLLNGIRPAIIHQPNMQNHQLNVDDNAEYLEGIITRRILINRHYNA